MTTISLDSIMAMVIDPKRSANPPNWSDASQYGQAVKIVMCAKPNLSRSSAIRLLNAALEIVDPVF